MPVMTAQAKEIGMGSSRFVDVIRPANMPKATVWPCARFSIPSTPQISANPTAMRA